MGVEGSITIEGREMPVSGNGWYDHEFGGDLPSVKKGKGDENGAVLNQAPIISSMQEAKIKSNHAWNWLSIQSDNQTELTATHLVNITTGETVDNYSIIIHSDSSLTEHHDMILTRVSTSVSPDTTNEFTIAWTLTIRSQRTSLQITSSFPNQEFLALIARPAFCEARVNVQGILHGQKVAGEGFFKSFWLQPDFIT